eukprot:scaffold1225_cov164-Amphora_coffeaeformis.AAC.11
MHIRTDRRGSKVAQEDPDLEQDNAKTGTEKEACQLRHGKMPRQGIPGKARYGQEQEGTGRHAQNGKSDFIVSQSLFQRRRGAAKVMNGENANLPQHGRREAKVNDMSGKDSIEYRVYHGNGNCHKGRQDHQSG